MWSFLQGQSVRREIENESEISSEVSKRPFLQRSTFSGAFFGRFAFSTFQLREWG